MIRGTQLKISQQNLESCDLDFSFENGVHLLKNQEKDLLSFLRFDFSSLVSGSFFVDEQLFDKNSVFSEHFFLFDVSLKGYFSAKFVFCTDQASRVQKEAQEILLSYRGTFLKEGPEREEHLKSLLDDLKKCGLLYLLLNFHDQDTYRNQNSWLRVFNKRDDLMFFVIDDVKERRIKNLHTHFFFDKTFTLRDFLHYSPSFFFFDAVFLIVSILAYILSFVLFSDGSQPLAILGVFFATIALFFFEINISYFEEEVYPFFIRKKDEVLACFLLAVLNLASSLLAGLIIYLIGNLGIFSTGNFSTTLIIEVSLTFGLLSFLLPFLPFFFSFLKVKHGS